jgi:hypothetical protein
MSVRPNISSLTMEGKDLVVRGETDDPLPAILRVVVAQDGAPEDAQGVEDADAKKIVAGWKARLKDTNLKPGPAQTMGIEVRANPLEIRTWFQSLDIE